jgi:hypothetical protein
MYQSAGMSIVPGTAVPAGQIKLQSTSTCTESKNRNNKVVYSSIVIDDFPEWRER